MKLVSRFLISTFAPGTDCAIRIENRALNCSGSALSLRNDRRSDQQRENKAGCKTWIRGKLPGTGVRIVISYI